MSLPDDFNKIFGSTATGGLTPINDVNYAKGWEFVGSNPPTKNDFTYLQNLTDQRLLWLYENYSSGRLLSVRVLTNTGTYTPTAGTKKIIVRATGAGGGGAGASAGGTNTYSVGGGGGGGSYVEAIFSSGFSSVPYSTGVGGAGGNPGVGGGVGSNGGDTIFGSLITAKGGSGGYMGTVLQSDTSRGNAGGGGFGGDPAVVSGAELVLVSMGGAFGSPGYMVSGQGGNGGNGAMSLLGYGGFGSSNGEGSPGRGYGSGGGGSLTTTTNTTGRLGGSGAPGIIIVWEFA